MTPDRHRPDPELYAHHATVLPVRDLGRARDFYRDKLGFEVSFEWQEPPTYAVLRVADTALHLSQVDPPGMGEPPPAIPSTLVYLFTHDVDALHDQIVAAGVEGATGPQTFEYNMREFELVDPDGHRLVFGQSVDDD